MNSLLNYGSDDDYEDSGEEKQTDWRGTSLKNHKDNKAASSSQQTDTNYEEVHMDLSEQESSEYKSEPRTSKRTSRDRDKDRRDNQRSRYDKDKRSSRDKNSRSRGDYKDKRYRERERKSRRSSSRERKRSRSPRRTERDDKHSRSRSKSCDRSRKHTKRYEHTETKSREYNKYDTHRAGEDEKKNKDNNESDRFFMPGITGRFRDQIERRKQLWQKKDNTEQSSDVKPNGQAKKVWETTTFAQDTDGKVANKFKRLMGIKNAAASTGQGVDVLKKQEEMFSSMEQQYEVARTATHTMRGVGLGFSSFQR